MAEITRRDAFVIVRAASELRRPSPPPPLMDDGPPRFRHPICSRCLVSAEVKPPTGRARDLEHRVTIVYIRD
ncbi:hypothetical protein C8035_v000095 [Colletotrichum spinosum]|uniref:Uncharacterized protein n=1 Tax=Colletotrichum spinosum TaxID=1347390 RepID=A0A4V3HQ28_9PEZI|nr:hypothetical protein C8035_v000095 [Colletotrichum spinosum]